MEALAFSTVLLPLKDADAKCRLLSALPPGFTLPVLCFFLAESHDRRGFKEEKYPLLASLHEYYTDRGTTIAACPPLDAVTMLKCLDEEFGWASGFLFGGFQGFVVLLTQLVITALRCRAQHPCDLGQLKQLYGELAAKIADSKNNAAAKLSPDAAVALAVTSHMVQQAAA